MENPAKGLTSIHALIGTGVTVLALVFSQRTALTTQRELTNQHVIDSTQRLVDAGTNVIKNLRLQAKMEQQLQHCLDTASDSRSCWSENYEFDPDQASTAWNSFDVALMTAGAAVHGQKKGVTMVKQLDAIRKGYYQEVPPLLGSANHDARRAADRIRRTTQDLEVELRHYQDVVLAGLT